MAQSFSLGKRQTLFSAGDAGYHTFRIPVLCRLPSGEVLAFAEARRDAAKDWGQIDLVLRRSDDGGFSFGPLQLVVQKDGRTCGNPVPVLNSTGKLLLLYCENSAVDAENLVFEGKGSRSVWLCSSSDAGRSFSLPREITQQVMPSDWTWYATGPGQGICLSSGRLVVPCDHAQREKGDHSDPVRSHVIFSDDAGDTWCLGGIVDWARSSECAIEEVATNQLYLEFRNDEKPYARGGAWSLDGGETFETATIYPELNDPGCRGGMALLRSELGFRGIVVSHCYGTRRRELVLQARPLLGAAFPTDSRFERQLVLEPGPAAYSDLLRNSDQELLCAFETGEQGPYERIDLVSIHVK